MVRLARALWCLSPLFLASNANAQGSVAQPAESARSRAGVDASSKHHPSWTAPSISGELGEGALREEEPIGAYGQPRWTAQRRFPTTRVYVRPAGTFQFEWWQETKLSLEDLDQVRHRSQFEFEFGLGRRLQLDLYITTEQLGHQGPYELKSEKVELRYALADWDVLPGNPTLYGEFIREHDGPPVAEFKFLLGGQLAPGWHWGTNATFERQLGADEEQEYAFTVAVSHATVDSVFSLGAELKLETVDNRFDRFNFDVYEVLAGPSIQWHPIPPVHIDLVALFGAEVENGESTPLAEPLLVAGWEF